MLLNVVFSVLITIVPFMDSNSNGKYDEGEEHKYSIFIFEEIQLDDGMSYASHMVYTDEYQFTPDPNSMKTSIHLMDQQDSAIAGIFSESQVIYLRIHQKTHFLYLPAILGE